MRKLPGSKRTTILKPPFAGAFALIASTFLAASAFADKVAVLPFLGTNATKQQLEDARMATRGAVMQRAHSLPSDSEMTTAMVAVADGTPDTILEYRAAG